MRIRSRLPVVTANVPSKNDVAAVVASLFQPPDDALLVWDEGENGVEWTKKMEWNGVLEWKEWKEWKES